MTSILRFIQKKHILWYIIYIFLLCYNTNKFNTYLKFLIMHDEMPYILTNVTLWKV